MSKVFVGSLPATVTEDHLKAEFEKFGLVAETFFKADYSAPNKSWAFVMFQSPDVAQAAVDALSGGKLVFPGTDQPCEVSMARSSTNPHKGAVTPNNKVFVGSIPVGTSEPTLRSYFEIYGQITAVFLTDDKQNPQRMWAFITYADSNAASLAVQECHEKLILPGGVRPVQLSYAKGRDAITGAPPSQGGWGGAQPSQGGTKLFVGSIPETITDAELRPEFEKYGQVNECLIFPNKTEAGRCWAFIIYADPSAAAMAAQELNNRLMLPGGTKPCEVHFAKDQSGSRSGPGAAGGGMQMQQWNPMMQQQQQYPMGGMQMGGMGGGMQMGGMQMGQGNWGQPQQQADSGQACKIFCGSLPANITDDEVRDAFSVYGTVTECHVKLDRDPSRKWAFLVFANHNEAQTAIDATNQKLTFPSSVKPCEVSLARNQGKFGQGTIAPGPGDAAWASQNTGLGGESDMRPRKVFVGSVPSSVDDSVVRAEFEKYGSLADFHMQIDKDPSRKWGFITFHDSQAAENAIYATHNKLTFPGSVKPTEVSMAKHQGKFGTDPIAGGDPNMQGGMMAGGGMGMGMGMGMQGGMMGGGMMGGGMVNPAVMNQGWQDNSGMYQQQQQYGGEQPKKIFVGSIPAGISKEELWQTFETYGGIQDMHLQPDKDPSRQWGFITYWDCPSAQRAIQAADGKLTFAGSVKPCEVTFARNQGLYGKGNMMGQDNSMNYGKGQQMGANGGMGQGYGQQGYGQGMVNMGMGNMGGYGMQQGMGMQQQQQQQQQQPPPPPGRPPQSSDTSWTQYKTNDGTPYYHNSVTGQTTWDCPPELLQQIVRQQPNLVAQAAGSVAGAPQQRYSPY